MYTYTVDTNTTRIYIYYNATKRKRNNMKRALPQTHYSVATVSTGDSLFIYASLSVVTERISALGDI